MLFTLNEARRNGFAEFLVDEYEGVYIGQQFIHAVMAWEGWTGWTDEDEEILLEGPGDWRYDEVWEEVLANAEYTDAASGKKWKLRMDCDLWMIREDVEICEKII